MRRRLYESLQDDLVELVSLMKRTNVLKITHRSKKGRMMSTLEINNANVLLSGSSIFLSNDSVTYSIRKIVNVESSPRTPNIIGISTRTSGEFAIIM